MGSEQVVLPNLDDALERGDFCVVGELDDGEFSYGQGIQFDRMSQAMLEAGQDPSVPILRMAPASQAQQAAAATALEQAGWYAWDWDGDGSPGQGRWCTYANERTVPRSGPA
jgi:hypothetical protein